MKKLIVTVFCLLIFVECFAQSAYSPQMVKAFADSLYTQGFWDEAESEYKRYFFMTDNALSDETAVLNLSHIYFNQKNKTGINWINANLKSFCDFKVQNQLEFIDSSFLFNERNQNAFHNFYTTFLTDTEHQQQLCPEWQTLYLLSDQVLQKDIKNAAQTANKGILQSSAFSPIAVSCENYKQKSAPLALSMSLVVPGSGKWYSGNFWTGLSDLLSISSFAGASVYYGREKGAKDWRPWTYGTIAAILYIVDLYGSYTGTKRYNQAQYYNLCGQVDELYEQLY